MNIYILTLTTDQVGTNVFYKICSELSEDELYDEYSSEFSNSAYENFWQFWSFKELAALYYDDCDSLTEEQCDYLHEAAYEHCEWYLEEYDEDEHGDLDEYDDYF